MPAHEWCGDIALTREVQCGKWKVPVVLQAFSVPGAGCLWKKGLNLAAVLRLMHSCIQPSVPALMVHLTGAGEEADSASPSLRFG